MYLYLVKLLIKYGESKWKPKVKGGNGKDSKSGME